MSDKEILELLRESFVSEDAPPLTAEEAEMFLSAPLLVELPPATLKKMRKRSAEQALARLHQEPVRRVRSHLTFGEWVAQARESARLTLTDVAAAVGKEASFFDQVEREQILPWKLAPTVMASIVTLFRIHIDAIARLLETSFRRRQEWEEAQKQMQAILQSRISGAGGDLRAAMVDLSDRDSSPAHDSPSEKPLSDVITRYLEKLRKALERRQAFDLL